MGARSLQRHLAEMGASYREMVAQVCLDMACRLSTYVRDGQLCCEYNLFEIQRSRFCSQQPRPASKVTIEAGTTYAEKKPTAPLNVALKVNGATVASGVVPVSAPLLFTAKDCLDIGIDLGSLGCFGKARFAFNGRIAEVKVK